MAATVVTLWQFLRVRDRRMLWLAAIFAFQAQALAREWWDIWRDVYQIGVCVAGLGLLFSLSPRPRAEQPPAAPPAPSREAGAHPIPPDAEAPISHG